MEAAAAKACDTQLPPPPAEAPTCPICMEPWACTGDHRICCIPCGHVYGRSCLEKWLRGKKTAKCPQCAEKFKDKQIINLYAPGNLLDGCCFVQEAKQQYESKIADLTRVFQNHTARSEELKQHMEGEIARLRAHLMSHAATIQFQSEQMSTLMSSLAETERVHISQAVTANNKLMAMKERMVQMAEEGNVSVQDMIEFMDRNCPQLATAPELCVPAHAANADAANTGLRWHWPQLIPFGRPPAAGAGDADMRKRGRQT